MATSTSTANASIRRFRSWRFADARPGRAAQPAAPSAAPTDHPADTYLSCAQSRDSTPGRIHLVGWTLDRHDPFHVPPPISDEPDFSTPHAPPEVTRVGLT